MAQDPFAALGFVPDAPAPGPAAGGGADFDALGFTSLSPMGAFDQKAKAFEDAIKRFNVETGGRLKPGQNIRQATAEWAGMPDPEPERQAAEIEELRQGGDVQYGGSVPYIAAKTLASMGGFATGGPAGATAAEGAVRGAALAANLKKAVDAGAITEDRAAEILAKDLAAGMVEDAAWNVAVPVLGVILRKVPGVQSLVQKVARKIKPVGAPAEPTMEAAQRATKVEQRAALAPDSNTAIAVKSLSARSGDFLPTPGQVTGKAGAAESTARIASLNTFDEQQEALRKAAEGLRGDVVAPAGQPSREAIGTTVQNLAEETQKALKNRLRPTFQAADQMGVGVDFSPVLARAEAALAADATVPGGRLVAQEREALATLVKDIKALTSPAVPARAPGQVASGLLDAGGAPIMRATPGVAAVPGTPPLVPAEQALDFISRQKERLRAVTADWKPSKFYETIVGGLTKDADAAFTAAAAKAGKPEVVTALRGAQSQYREMMEAVYEDAVKAALKKNPEDVGRLFWQRGNVSEPKQMQKLLQLAIRERNMTPEAARELSDAMTRGFMQEAVPNVGAAAKWSQTLREKPGLRDTWEALTNTPGGRELRSAMGVLEEAAKIAERGNPEMVGAAMAAIPVRRAASWGVGVSLVTGGFSPVMAVTGLTVAGMLKMMATAYAQGNKGVLNTVMRAMRAAGAGTAASTKVLQETLPKIEQYAAEHGIEDIFVPAPEGQQ